MNIKTINTTPVIPLEPNKRVEGRDKTKGSADRDANGRQEQGDHQAKRHLTQQEFDDAIKALTEHPGLKSNNLTIEIETKDDCRVITIVSPDGKVVRRLSESQLWTATRDLEKQTGRILDKAM